MTLVNASVAHLVERHLAKVEVASSSLVTRSSKTLVPSEQGFFLVLPPQRPPALPRPAAGRFLCAAQTRQKSLFPY